MIDTILKWKKEMISKILKEKGDRIKKQDLKEINPPLNIITRSLNLFYKAG